MKQAVVAGFSALSIALLLWDNGYTAADWNIFLRGCFVGIIATVTVLGFGRRATS